MREAGFNERRVRIGQRLLANRGITVMPLLSGYDKVRRRVVVNFLRAPKDPTNEGALTSVNNNMGVAAGFGLPVVKHSGTELVQNVELELIRRRGDLFQEFLNGSARPLSEVGRDLSQTMTEIEATQAFYFDGPLSRDRQASLADNNVRTDARERELRKIADEHELAIETELQQMIKKYRRDH